MIVNSKGDLKFKPQKYKAYGVHTLTSWGFKPTDEIFENSEYRLFENGPIDLVTEEVTITLQNGRKKRRLYIHDIFGISNKPRESGEETGVYIGVEGVIKYLESRGFRPVKASEDFSRFFNDQRNLDHSPDELERNGRVVVLNRFYVNREINGKIVQELRTEVVDKEQKKQMIEIARDTIEEIIFPGFGVVSSAENPNQAAASAAY